MHNSCGLSKTCIPSKSIKAIEVPGDKSIAHRLIFLSAMAQGTTHLGNVPQGKDVLTSLSVIEQLGFKVVRETDSKGLLGVAISGDGVPLRRFDTQQTISINCNNSGTTARFLTGLLAACDNDFIMRGDESLSNRPMRRLLTLLSDMGVRLTGQSDWPCSFSGSTNLCGTKVILPVASAQMKTALIFAGMQAHGETLILEPSLSRNHTELLAPLFGARVERLTTQEMRNALRLSVSDMHSCEHFSGVRVIPYQNLLAPEKRLTVPCDPSSAAYWLVFAVLSHYGEVLVKDVCLNPTRIGFVRCMQKMGAKVKLKQTGWFGQEAVGLLFAQSTQKLSAIQTQDEDSACLIDEIPILSLLCAQAQGTSVFRNVGELCNKESNRLSALLEGLTALGIKAYSKQRSNQMIDLYIEGSDHFSPQQDCILHSYRDHRMAMTWAIARTCCEQDISVTDLDAIAISYPSFLKELATHVQ